MPDATQPPVAIQSNSLAGVQAFHAHLNCCSICRGTPFGLCAEGQRLLQAATAETLDQYRAACVKSSGKKHE